MTTAAYIFDVEGTLVDSVPQTLTSWREALLAHGHDVPIARLQAYSGMDGNDLLKALLPDLESAQRKAILEAQGERFEREYLSTVKPFPGVQATLQSLRASGRHLALATDCKGASLRHYRQALQIDGLLDAVASGEEVPEGKPDPRLVQHALDKLELPAASCVMIGDTPYDARAATAAGVPCIGVLTGGFARGELLAAGCVDVAADVRDAASLLAREDPVARARRA